MSMLHAGAVYALFLLPSASAATLAWSFICFMISALGVTAGAHRLWSHRSYKASLPLRMFLATANSMAFQNDIYEWARDHRVHHKYSETDADPHNAVRGFFFSHIGWLLVRKHPDVIEKGRKLELGDLRADKVVMFQRKEILAVVSVQGIQFSKADMELIRDENLTLENLSPLFTANRETAFVHAISSAGVMYTLTRNCSLGDFDNSSSCKTVCSVLCTGGQGWLWGGCSDNVGFGEAISKQFVDALETGQDARAAMNLHNNEAGRKAVKGTMKRTCKCHGVSGSCTTQTCWLQLPEFREVGNYLKEKYHKALKVDLLKGAGNSAASRGAIAETFSSISKKELVHLEDSPDYCLENKTLGLQGTEGRECVKKGKNLTKWEKRSCKRLCGECGLAVEERKAEMVSSCNCKFHWCCAVKCEQCRKIVTKYFCVKKERRGKNESTSRRKTLRLRKKH
ncbi:WNT8B protein, partial [Amia calva]|nr:WNT8B protein [Amia calva]